MAVIMFSSVTIVIVLLPKDYDEMKVNGPINIRFPNVLPYY